MEPIDFLGALRRGWRLLVALAVLGAVIAVAIPASSPHKKKSPLPYEASAVVGSVPSGGSAVSGTVNSSQIQFYASLNSTQELAAQLDGLNVPNFVLSEYMTSQIGVVNPAPSSGSTTTTLKGKRNLSPYVSLLARGKTLLAAVDLANTYSAAVSHVIQADADARAAASAKGDSSANSADASDTGGTDGSTDTTTPRVQTGFQVEQPASYAYKTNKHPASLGASKKVRLGAGFVIGLVVGAGILLLRELLDKRLRNRTRAEANFGFPVVVEIPTGPPVGGKKSARGATAVVDVVGDPDSAGAEAYRMLRMSVMFEALAADAAPIDPYGMAYAGFGNGNANGNGRLGGGGPGEARAVPSLSAVDTVSTLPEHLGTERQVILVVSPGLEPSRPHVAANLAAVYAEANQRVVVISTGDIEPGRRRRSVPVTTPITTDAVRDALEPSRLELVSRLPLAGFIGTSGQLVTRAPDVLRAARRLADAVIVEVPPLLAVHHAEALAHSSDVVLVVGECGWTTFHLSLIHI